MLQRLIYTWMVFLISSGWSSEPFPFDLRSIKSHIDEKLAQVHIELDPFPYFVIQDIFPDEFYEYMSQKWPSENSFDRNGRTRRRLPVTQNCLEKRTLPEDQKYVWRLFGEVVVNQYIKERVKELLLPFLEYKFSFASPIEMEFIKKNIKFMNCRSDGLNLDKLGYFINPHVDQSHIFAAMLFYFPSDSSHSEHGTVFYKSLRGRTSIDVQFLPPSEFVQATKIPFIPNTMVVFLQNPVGWHGVESISDPTFQRKAYHASISLSPEFTERVYGPSFYTAASLYCSDERYLDPENFRGF